MTDHKTWEPVCNLRAVRRYIFPLVPSSETHVSKSTIKDIYLRAISKIAEFATARTMCNSIFVRTYEKRYKGAAPPLNCRALDRQAGKLKFFAWYKCASRRADDWTATATTHSYSRGTRGPRTLQDTPDRRPHQPSCALGVFAFRKEIAPPMAPTW